MLLVLISFNGKSPTFTSQGPNLIKIKSYTIFKYDAAKLRRKIEIRKKVPSKL